MLRAPLLTLLCLLAVTSPVVLAEYEGREQDRDLAARFAGGSVTWREFWIELARRHRGKDLGKDALDFLLQKALVELEAERRRIEVSDAAVERRVALIRQQLRAQRQISLEDYLANMGLDLARFRETTRTSLIANELVRLDLGLPADSEVQNQDLRLWVQEMRKRHEVVTDPAQLDADVALRIGTQRLGLARLGEIMVRKLSEPDRREILEQMVAYRLLDRKARELELEITQKDLDASLTERREEILANETYRRLEVDFEGLLRAQGRTLHDFVQGEVFRAQVYMRRLAEELFPPERLDRELEERRQYWLDRHGAQRLIHWIVLLGGDGAGPRGRSLDEAKSRLATLAESLESEADFAAAAKRYSEERATGELGGKLGYRTRHSTQLPEPFLQAAFELEIGRISPPLPVPGGYALALVTAERPAPPDPELRERIRHSLIQEQVRKWIEESKVEFFAPGL